MKNNNFENYYFTPVKILFTNNTYIGPFKLLVNFLFITPDMYFKNLNRN